MCSKLMPGSIIERAHLGHGYCWYPIAGLLRALPLPATTCTLAPACAVLWLLLLRT